MRLAIIFTSLLGLFYAVVPVAAQNNIRQMGLGFHTFTTTAFAGDRETIVITYTGLEDTQIQLFEANLPAASAAECLATSDFTDLEPISADRTAQTYADGKKVVVVQTPSERFGRCHVIVGRSGVDDNDFNVWRSNFGRLSGLSGSGMRIQDDIEQIRPTATGPIYRIGRLFPE